MTSLDALINRPLPALAWVEGDNIPWNEPSFSERMLAEHLTQEHDLASRTTDTIEAQVTWIHATVLDGRTARVLDLTCGPGLYLDRLAGLGHSGVGIDFSPASIRHARDQARRRGSDVEFVEGDIRTVEFGSGFDAALLLYGQLNVFRRHEASDILARIVQALTPGGSLIVEPQTFEHVRNTGIAGASWSSHREGLFSPEPHLLLTESFWDDQGRSTTERFHVIDTGGEVRSHAMTTEAYSGHEIRSLLDAAGLVDIHEAGDFPGSSVDGALAAWVGRRPGFG